MQIRVKLQLQKKGLLTKRQKANTSKPHFQVALSFAGADRGFAKKLARLLKSFGLGIFFDSDNLEEIAGEDVNKLREIYGERSEVIVPIISEHYAKSDFTQVEFDAALQSERKGTAKIVPVRLDDTPQFGLRTDKVFLDPADHSIKAIARAIAAKCGVDVSEHTGRESKKKTVPLLSAESRKAFGLIASSRLPFTLDDFQQFFPDLDWNKSQKELERNGLVQFADKVVVAEANSTKTILSSKVEKEAFRAAWKNALEPLRYHTDLALELALIYLDEGEWAKGVQLLVDVANSSNTGYWSKVYIATFESILKSKFWRKLSQTLRLALKHALGKCLSHTEEYEKSIAVLSRARTEAKRASDTTWLNQILLTMGVAHHHKGEMEIAKQLYEEVVSLAEECNDQLLIGRALGNLATLKQSESPHLAKELLKQSIEAKRAAKDKTGEAVAVFQLGTIEANHDQPELALVQYERCLELKKKSEFCVEPEDALLFHNVGLAHLECSRTECVNDSETTFFIG